MLTSHFNIHCCSHMVKMVFRLKEVGARESSRYCEGIQNEVTTVAAFFKHDQFFGCVIGVVYTIEFQKRGLPHAHILLFLALEDKIKGFADIDNISTKIPNKESDPVLYDHVKEFRSMNLAKLLSLLPHLGIYLFGFETLYREPTVERLVMHLLDEESIMFQDDEPINNG
ncbi:hypothetical protein L6164_016650 [Bauhinia variegata]|uniref:Uncharacterized protein n=1 Tax=Bauhinia variegata TaxID=167791 RepID=A0ACB9NPB3_BAUVA|nr:hypothetical protein L6164_016650 [Bauhinia variegata]